MQPRSGVLGSMPRVALATGVGAVALVVALLVPEDDDSRWFAALAALASALLLTCVSTIALEAFRRRERGRRAPRLGLPEWASSLPNAQFRDLEHRFNDMESRLRSTEREAVDHRRRASRSVDSMWHVIEAAVNSEERARGRFVADLHDTVVQTLVVSAYLAEDEDVPREQLAESMREAERQLRDLMVVTRPPDLRRELGVSAGNLGRLVYLRHGLVVSWEWPRHHAELPSAVASTIYRFWQEGLANVAKHAGVDQARAGLRLGSQIEAWVEDEGSGFNPESVPADAVDASAISGHHAGLGLMSDRARQIGARTEVISTPGRGTRVAMTLPYPPTHVGPTVDIGAPPPPLVQE